MKYLRPPFRPAVCLICVLFGSIASAEEAIRWSAYCTADSVAGFRDGAAREEALATLRAMGISRVFLEVRRGDSVADESLLRELRSYFENAGLAVVGGIATVPGATWGVPANEGLAWLNYQAPQTQADIEAAVRMAARVFDHFIVDDFLLSGDTSPESDAARGRRTWGEYRRDLLTSLSQRMIITPAKAENPGINVILKFPQSYDRYHTFGYDVAREPQLYDQVWVGTETRGQYTQRFGFTQPYEGFVNYRWIDSLSGGKLGGAWFDFGDCDGPDFVEQAWQSVLAGAREIVLFSYAGLAEPHPGHEMLRQDLPGLEQLARVVRQHPVTGVAAYKPANSDPGSDMYVMDYIGMLGIPLVPVSRYPAESAAIFVPAYGARDPDIVTKIEASLLAGKTVVVTTGLLAGAADSGRLAALAGLAVVPEVRHARTTAILLDGERFEIPNGLDLGGALSPLAATVVLAAEVDGVPVPYLTTRAIGSGRLSVLNVHQFTPEDFSAVNEVLLSPRDLGILQLPEPWVWEIRAAFRPPGAVVFEGPARVSFQPLGEAGWFIQNYNREPVTVSITEPAGTIGLLRDGFSGESTDVKGNSVKKEMSARSRWWIAR